MEYKSGFGRSGCHIENIGELLQEFDAEYVTDDGKVIKLDGEAVLSLMADLFAKFEETMFECENKTVEIEFGDSVTANLLEQVIKFVLSFAKKKAENEAKA